MPAARFIVVLALLTPVLACSRFERSRECNGYARLVNRALEDVRADQAGKPSPEMYRRIAERYDRLAKDLEHVRPSDPALEQLLTEYRMLYRQTTVTLGQLIPLLGKPEQAVTLRREKTALDALIRQERGLAQRFESVCRGP